MAIKLPALIFLLGALSGSAAYATTYSAASSAELDEEDGRPYFSNSDMLALSFIYSFKAYTNSPTGAEDYVGVRGAFK
jgi:hypothetical protein